MRMITSSNIVEFFEQYKRNLEREEALNEAVLDAEDQEVWMENLRAKSRGLRQIYVENEALLNLYLRPFLEQESRLTKELAAEFLKGLVDLAEQGVCDRLVCIRTGKLLKRFFQKKNDRDSLLITVHVLGNFYSQFSMREDYENAAACFDVERKQLAHYAELEDWNIRRRVLFAFYNYAVILVNGRQCYEKEKETSYRHQHDIIRAADEAIAAYDNPVVRGMDGDKYDLDGLKEELLYDVFGNWICGCDQRDDMVPEMLERCCTLLDSLYQNALKESLQAHPGKGEDSLEVACGIQDEIYCNYWKAKVYLEKIGLEEYLHKMMEYFEVTRNDFGEETTAIVDSRGYQINMYHLVNLAGTPGLAEHTELLEKVGKFILPRFTEFVEKLPRNDRATFVNGTVRNALMELFRTLGTKHVDAYYFLNMLMNRDEISLMHSILVERLALVLLRHVMDEKPELLVGMRNTANVVEVLEKRGEFEKFVSDTALFYDIGKLNYLELILLQNRRLEPEEMELLREHSREGYEMLKKLNFDPELCDVALGHHKSYDGKHGYPANFDHTASAARFMIDLFRICDRMEAATDEIGRVYRQNRGIEVFWEELKLGAGYLYQPQLVEMILNDDGLRGELSYLCSGGRIAVYYSTYHDFVGGRVEKKTERRGGSLCGSGAASSGAGGNDKYAAGKYSGGKSRTASGVGVPCEIYHSSGANLSGRGSCVSGASHQRSGVGRAAGGNLSGICGQSCKRVCAFGRSAAGKAPDGLWRARGTSDVHGRKLRAGNPGLDKGRLPLDASAVGDGGGKKRLAAGCRFKRPGYRYGQKAAGAAKRGDGVCPGAGGACQPCKEYFFIEYVARHPHADERDYGNDADRFGKYRGTGAGDGLPWKNRAGVRASSEIDQRSAEYVQDRKRQNGTYRKTDPRT